MTKASAAIVAILIALVLWMTAISAQTSKAGRFQYYTYQLMDGNSNDQCVYVFYAGQPPTLSLTSVVIQGACNQ